MINIFNFRLFLQYLLLNLLLFTGSIYSQKANNSIKDNDTYFGWEGHNSGLVFTIAFNKDYTLFATGGIDNCIRIWDSETYSLKKVFTGNLSRVNYLIFSGDGKNIISCNEDKTIKFMDVGTGQIVRNFNLGNYRAEKIALSSDGSFIAALEIDLSYFKSRIAILNTTDGSVRKVLSDSGVTTSIAISKDDKKLISGGADEFLRIWDINSGTSDTSIFCKDNWITDLKYSSDGVFLFILNTNGSMVKRRTSDWSILNSAKPTTYANNMDITADGSKIIISDQENLILLEPDGSIIKKWNSQSVKISSLKFTQDGTKIIAAAGQADWESTYSQYPTLRIWNSIDGSLFKDLPGHTVPVTSIDVSENGKYIATYGLDMYARLWNTDGTLLKTMSYSRDASGVSISPKGSFIITEDLDYLKIISNKNNFGEEKKFMDKFRRIIYTTFSNDESKLLIADINNRKVDKFIILDAKTWNPVDTISCAAAGDCIYPQYLPGDSLFLVFGVDFNAKIINVRTEKLVKSFPLKNTPDFYRPSLSSDGKMFVYHSSNGVYLFSIPEGKLIREFPGFNSGVTSSGLSPDGSLIAASARDGIISIWDSFSGILKKNITYSGGLPNSIRFTYDGKKIIAGGSGYNNIRIYDISDITVGIKKNPENKPENIILYQNYPNPFNPSTVISFEIGAQNFAPVQLKIYDILGREVKTLVNDYKPSGKYEYTFDGTGLSSGIYYCRLSVKGYPLKQIPMMLVK